MRKKAFAFLALFVCVSLFCASILCGCDDTGDERRRNPSNNASSSDTSHIGEKYTESIDTDASIGIQTEELTTDFEEYETEIVDETVEATIESSSEDTEKPDVMPIDEKFELSYELSKTKYLRGETVELVATVKNVSGEPYSYMGSQGEFMAQAYLKIGQGCMIYEIQPEPIALTQEFRQYTIADGESRSVTHRFHIPEDAMPGSYSLELYYGGVWKEYRYAVTVYEEIDVYVANYTGTKITVGDQRITPVSGFVSSSFYDSETGEGSEGDGGGAYHYFYEIESWGRDDFLPDIAKNTSQKISVELPEGSELYRVCVACAGGVYDDLEEISLEDLNGLDAGEYYVVIGLIFEERSDNGSYSIDVYEDIFKLTVN